MKYKNRTEAGRKLAARLKEYAGMNAVVLALPRGGVPIGYEVANATGLPLHLLMVKKIGHPQQREYAIGAVGLEDSYILPNAGVSERYIEQETRQVRQRLLAMQEKFGYEWPGTDLLNKTIILVDDGIATGNTVLAAIHILRKQAPAKIVVAVPVCSRLAAVNIRRVSDEFLSLEILESFTSVGSYYHDFHQVTDEEVLACLTRGHKAAT